MMLYCLQRAGAIPRVSITCVPFTLTIYSQDWHAKRPIKGIAAIKRLVKLLTIVQKWHIIEPDIFSVKYINTLK